MSAAPDLILEHKEGNKVKKSLRIQARSNMFLIGSSRSANLRLRGESISGCHMVLKYRAPHWYACDLSGFADTKLDEKNIVEQKLEDLHVLTMGHHQIRLLNKPKNQSLFTNQHLDGAPAKQQVVIRRGWGIVQTLFLDQNQNLELKYDDAQINLPPPKSGEWIVSEMGRRVIQQRLVPAQDVLDKGPYKIDKEFTKAFATAIMIIMFLFVGFKLAPSATTAKDLDAKSMDMIFNAKAIQKKRLESKKVQMAAKAKRGGQDAPANVAQAQPIAPDQSQAPKISNKTTVALNNLRASGLNSLIGKIAKRAVKSGIMVATSGVTPEKASGRAFYSTGTATVGGGGAAVKSGGTFKLGGIATKGIGGGASNVGEGTALLGGKVGQGDVALIDDETVIDGGLDKDVIAEVIRKNIGQVRECYERQLSANRDLYGKVLVHFVINAQGAVNEPKIEHSTMKSSMVEGCMLRRLSNWKFPMPRGGTMVKVSYPFLFKALD